MVCDEYGINLSMSPFSDLSSSRKRKVGHESVSEFTRLKKLKSRHAARGKSSVDSVRGLEENLTNSRLHYNQVARLIEHARTQDVPGLSEAAIAALCRTFSRMLAAGVLSVSEYRTQDDVIISQWLQQKYLEFVDFLYDRVANGTYDSQALAVDVLMHLVREDSFSAGDVLVPSKRAIRRLLELCITGARYDRVRLDFCRKFLEPYDDVKLFTLDALSQITSSNLGADHTDAAISVLGCICTTPESALNLYFSTSMTQDLTSHLTKAQAKSARISWTHVFQQPLKKAQRKSLLGLLIPKISPWFPQIELLVDFLTDSFNVEGSTSLMALSGLLYLMQEKNLDYPHFYVKIYSMLDSKVLHSKHRSRFLRLLVRCLESTHLPATLVASFIKRLSQIALQSSPSGIVVAIPLVYNLLHNHPLSTFMIHQDPPGLRQGYEDEEHLPHEPFLADMEDPMITQAERSSVWEIKSLQSHYHPAVAMLARIISEPFFKSTYSTEDFLDHSYDTIIETSLIKEMKTVPAVEHNISKQIFTSEAAHSHLGAWDALPKYVWQFPG